MQNNYSKQLYTAIFHFPKNDKRVAGNINNDLAFMLQHPFRVYQK